MAFKEVLVISKLWDRVDMDNITMISLSIMEISVLTTAVTTIKEVTIRTMVAGTVEEVLIITITMDNIKINITHKHTLDMLLNRTVWDTISITSTNKGGVMVQVIWILMACSPQVINLELGGSLIKMKISNMLKERVKVETIGTSVVPTQTCNNIHRLLSSREVRPRINNNHSVCLT